MLLKLTVPPENLAWGKLTMPPENPAWLKWTTQPSENLAPSKSTVPPENSALSKMAVPPENLAPPKSPGGMRAIVTGRLRQRSYETKDGEKRTVHELQVDEAGPSLRNVTAKVTRTTRPGNGQPADTGGLRQLQRRAAVLTVDPTSRGPVPARQPGRALPGTGRRRRWGWALLPGCELSYGPAEPVKGACGVATRPASPALDRTCRARGQAAVGMKALG